MAPARTAYGLPLACPSGCGGRNRDVSGRAGNTGAIKWFSGLGEIRIDWGPGYRVYLVRDGETLIVLFGGGTKASQSKDIVRAKELLAEYKIRKRAQPSRTPTKNKR